MNGQTAASSRTAVFRHRLEAWLSERIVSLNPPLFVDALRRRHPDDAARRLNMPAQFRLANCDLPPHVRDFKDLHSLFWLSPLNRGVLRLDLDEAAALFELVRSIEAPVGVEIGRYFGGSTILLAAAIGEWGRLISIDRDPRDDEALEQVLRRARLSRRVTLLAADANDIDWPGPFDFVFIDGDHTYGGAKSDLSHWAAHLRRGGYVIFHDMAHARALATDLPDLARLREELLAQEQAPLALDREVGSVSIWRRTETPWTALARTGRKGP